MIPTPFSFESKITNEEFQKLGRFAVRWSHIEHTIGNCLRRMLEMSPKHATIMVFPLSLDLRMARIGDLAKIQPLSEASQALLKELKPLIRAMQFLRTSALHGIVIHFGGDEDPYFQLRSKNRDVDKDELFGCEDLINYTAHVALAFRLTLGDKPDDRGSDYALPNRPDIPSFLPDDCHVFPQGAIAGPRSRPKSSPQ